MFVGRKGILTLNCLMILTQLSPVKSIRTTSTLFKMVQPATASPQHGNRIRCAYSAMHHSYAGIRIVEGSGMCERLTDAEMDIDMEASFEYFRKYSESQQLQPNLVACLESGESITIYTYTKVKVGDIFEFVVQRCGTDTFSINFKTSDDSTALHLVFRSSEVWLNTWSNIWGEEEKCSTLDPLASYKEYSIGFEIFDTYYKICIDQTVCCQYDHRLPVSTITRATVPFYPLSTLKSVKITTAVP